MALSHTKQSLYEQLTEGRRLEQKIEQLQSLQQHIGDLERQLASKTTDSALLTARMKEVDGQLAPENARSRELVLQLAEANAKALAQSEQELGVSLETERSIGKEAGYGDTAAVHWAIGLDLTTLRPLRRRNWSRQLSDKKARRDARRDFSLGRGPSNCIRNVVKFPYVI